MEGVLPKVRCQIIADFNGKNAAKWKMSTVRHFKKMECKKTRPDTRPPVADGWAGAEMRVSSLFDSC